MSNLLRLLSNLRYLAGQLRRPVRLMEVCGTHTEAITRSGLRAVLPPQIELITGPGCPVCVTPSGDIDAVVGLALSGVPVACYGDVLRVPGTEMSLEQTRGKGGKVSVVYSVEEALQLRKGKPSPVFFGIGFETTAPMTAAAIKRGLMIYSAHKYFPPAMQALVRDPQIKIDGFINPGHVSTIVGLKPYRAIKKPQVVAGFEPEDVLLAIIMLLRQIKTGQSKVENEYRRLVKPAGNTRAQKLIAEVFRPVTSEWRGLGKIARSGMAIKKKYAKYDAAQKYRQILQSYLLKIKDQRSKIVGCRCGEVIKGLINPAQCTLFGQACTPEKPIGACMVSREGACRIEYEYRE
jgi:hydrogenase expression/formation protein HypD